MCGVCNCNNWYDSKLCESCGEQKPEDDKLESSLNNESIEKSPTN